MKKLFILFFIACCARAKSQHIIYLTINNESRFHVRINTDIKSSAGKIFTKQYYVKPRTSQANGYFIDVVLNIIPYFKNKAGKYQLMTSCIMPLNYNTSLSFNIYNNPNSDDMPACQIYNNYKILRFI